MKSVKEILEQADVEEISQKEIEEVVTSLLRAIKDPSTGYPASGMEVLVSAIIIAQSNYAIADAIKETGKLIAEEIKCKKVF